MGGMDCKLAYVKEEMWEDHHVTGPVLGRTQNNQKQWRSVVIHLTEAFPGRFRLGEWDAFILCCLDEEGLRFGGATGRRSTGRRGSLGSSGEPCGGASWRGQGDPPILGTTLGRCRASR